ncbi:hypothetical protein SNOG_08564 [Parastagonospora nodorum SN15]|uniref:Uncharacterized protein n=1 Tax=Phaeosphaeria nodorum (strain SN15 / ATCC MYA-4574 / FGSC 10173) TaxID=321614 RepID=Q0UI50_PHANO|nr:hypothetical protein SNOG_08564 [Parastagonospora nodorum SN15]EAT83732.1 hypothetical protein SNOG_08564 [Parastagonospora nodorum SN15]
MDAMISVLRGCLLKGEGSHPRKSKTEFDRDQVVATRTLRYIHIQRFKGALEGKVNFEADAKDNLCSIGNIWVDFTLETVPPGPYAQTDGRC